MSYVCKKKVVNLINLRGPYYQTSVRVRIPVLLVKQAGSELGYKERANDTVITWGRGILEE